MADPREREDQGTADDGAWFAPRRYGLGAGLPLRWQGWALLAGYLAVLIPVPWLLGRGQILTALAAAAILGLATFALIMIARAKTRGGWKWRWGEE